MKCKPTISKLSNLDIRRSFSSLLYFIVFFALSGSAFAANENFPASGNFSTSTDWITITGTGVTVTVTPSGTNIASSNGTATGFSVDANTHTDAIINFLGNSTVAGTIGVTGGTVAQVNGGSAGTSVTFDGQVVSTLVDFIAGSTMTFNTSSSAALHFAGFNGTAALANGITFNGAATTTAPGTGIVTLNSGSTWIGAIGTPTNYVNQINLPTGNAAITGATVAQNITVGPNILAQTGGLTFPAGSIYTLTASSDTTYGQILAGAVSLTSGLTVEVNVPNTASFSGAPLQVISGSGASGNTVTALSLNPRYSFTALNNSSDPLGNGSTNSVLLFPAVQTGIPSTSPAAAAAAAFTAATSADAIYVNSLLGGLGSLSAIASAEAQFAPIVNGANAILGFQALNQFQGLWEQNLLRGRGADICYNRCDPCPGCPTLCNPCTCNGRKNAWNGEGFWMDGFGYFADQHTRKGIPGYDGQIYGVMMALQRPISRHWQVGIGAGYAFTHIGGSTAPGSDGYSTAANHMNDNTYAATAYLGYNRGAFFFDSFFTFDWTQYRGYRDIVFSGLNRVASSKYDGQGYSVLLETGYNIFFGSRLTLTPLASIDFQELHIDGYTETGAGSLDLTQKSQNYEVIQSGLGLMAGFPLIVNCCDILYTEAHAIWFYDIENFRYKNTSSFTGGGPAFDTVGLSPAPSEVNLGISTTIYTRGRWSLQLGYDAYYSSDYLGQEGNASISYRF